MSKKVVVSEEFIVPAHRHAVRPGIKQTPLSMEKISILSLALAACFAPVVAQADCVTGGSFVSNASGTESWGAGDCSIASGANISGGSPALVAVNNVGTLTNNGRIAGGETGFRVNSTYTVGAVTNNGTISASSSYGIRNQGTIGSLTNNGLISASYAGLFNDTNGSVNILNNMSGATITGISYGIINSNNATISALSNDGLITSSGIGVYNGANSTIVSLTNDGSIVGNAYGIQSDNGSHITSLENTRTGLIRGGTGVLIGNLTPTGTITVGTLSNAGSISGTTNVGVGTSSNGSIGRLTNSGVISGAQGGIGNAGNMGSLVNSGTITSSGYAIYTASNGTLGPVENSGLISGTIANLSSRSMTINGGSNTTFGTLTGSSGGTGSADIGAFLSGASLYFDSGNLLLNDNINVSNNTVNNTGATLQVNNVLNINGNYTQGADASLLIGVASGATTQGVNGSDLGYGRLVVSRAANIASGSSIGLKSLGYAFATGQRYVVINAATAGTNYNASTLNYSATGYTGSIVGTSVVDGANNNLVLALVAGPTPVTPTPVTPTPGNNAQATTPNAVASLEGLQRYSGISDADLLNLYNASLAISSTAEGNKAGEQLSPNQNVSAGSATTSATFDMINVIGNRLSNVDSIKIAQSGKGESGISTGDDFLQQAGWGQIFGGRARQDATDDISGYRANYGGAVIGYDHAITDDWRLGGAVSYTYTSVNGKDNVQGSSSNVKSYGLTGYASYVAPKWYSNLYAAVLQQNYSTQRQVSFTGYDGVANGDFDGQQYALKAEFGYPIALSENVVLTPLANASYSYLHQDGYTESGGNGAALQVDSAHTDSVKSGLGAKLETTLSTPWGDVVPYTQVLWNHQYNNDRMAVSAAYAAATDETNFVSRGITPVKDSADLTVGATLLGSGNTSLTAYYDLGLAPNYTNQSVSLRIKQLF
ncbi:autotransporter domain-containing protein [Erwinia sp. AnSW2-5]|uniref:autotransporter family protein n=1 Tax=Erwinia sp. AnSW2-5 TaxID=3367692 RepID=UPI00385E569F